MNKQQYEQIKEEQLQEQINEAFEFAVALIKTGNCDKRLWISKGLNEPYRSQTWQQACEYCGVTEWTS